MIAGRICFLPTRQWEDWPCLATLVLWKSEQNRKALKIVNKRDLRDSENFYKNFPLQVF